jgi:hypothetical protein
MKRNLTYSIVLLLMICIAAACTKKTDVVNYQLTVPTGSFTGKFIRLHLTHATNKVDTINANSLLLNLDASGNFTVTGDTSVHAGSFGKYGLGVGSDLVFTDKTFPTTGTPAKQHLNGDYLYTYNSGILEMLRNVSDSLSYQYIFTKN